MPTNREITLLSLFIFVFAIALYFLLYLRPVINDLRALNQSVTQLYAELADAESINQQHAALLGEHSALMQAWDCYQTTLPQVFDGALALRRIQAIVYPHAENVQLAFFDKSVRESMFSTTATIRFVATYGGLMEVLEGFATDGRDNRVVSYSVSAGGNEGDLMDIMLQVEFLSLHA